MIFVAGAVLCRTMLCMAKRRPRSGSEENVPPTVKRSDYPVSARIDGRIRAAIDAYLASTRPRPTFTSFIETAIIDLLEKKGFWPPKD